jgi:hypothetical protein
MCTTSRARRGPSQGRLRFARITGPRELCAEALPFSAELDPPTATLFRKLDGSSTLKPALAIALDDKADHAIRCALALMMLSVGFLDLAD